MASMSSQPNKQDTEIDIETIVDTIVNSQRSEANPALPDVLRSVHAESVARNWRQVIRLCFDALQGSEKDVRVAVSLTVALGHRFGLCGLSAGVRLLSELHARLFTALSPTPSGTTDDLRVRYLEQALHRTLPELLRQLPLISVDEGASLSLARWQAAQEVDKRRLAFEKESEREKKAKLATTCDADAAAERIGTAALLLPFSELKEELIEQLIASLPPLRKSLIVLEAELAERYGQSAPAVSELLKLLEPCGELLAACRCSRPAPRLDSTSPPAATVATERAETAALPAKLSRDEVMRQLRALHDYLRVHEPHNPARLLLRRALEWSEQPIESFVARMLENKDELTRLVAEVGEPIKATR